MDEATKQLGAALQIVCPDDANRAMEELLLILQLDPGDPSLLVRVAAEIMILQAADDPRMVVAGIKLMALGTKTQQLQRRRITPAVEHQAGIPAGALEIAEEAARHAQAVGALDAEGNPTHEPPSAAQVIEAQVEAGGGIFKTDRDGGIFDLPHVEPPATPAELLGQPTIDERLDSIERQLLDLRNILQPNVQPGKWFPDSKETDTPSDSHTSPALKSAADDAAAQEAQQIIEVILGRIEGGETCHSFEIEDAKPSVVGRIVSAAHSDWKAVRHGANKIVVRTPSA